MGYGKPENPLVSGCTIIGATSMELETSQVRVEVRPD